MEFHLLKEQFIVSAARPRQPLATATSQIDATATASPLRATRLPLPARPKWKDRTRHGCGFGRLEKEAVERTGKEPITDLGIKLSTSLMDEFRPNI